MRRWAVCDADWNHWPDGLSDAAIWPAAAEAGFGGMEIGVRTVGADLASARLVERERLAGQYRLPVRAVLLSLPADRWPRGALTGDVQRVVSDASACAAVCVRLGLDLLGVSLAADPAGASWSRLISGLARVRDVAAARGVGVAVEFAPGTAVATCADALRLAADVPGTGVLLDTGQAAAGGEDPAECVRRLDRLLWHVHLGGGHEVEAAVAALDATYAGVATVDVRAEDGTGAAAAAEALRSITGASG